jgi:organic radical activating enzyme
MRATPKTSPEVATASGRSGPAGRPPSGLVSSPKTLSIMPTYTCTAACTHCASLSNPQERTRLPLATMLAAIDEAKSLGFYNVVFTGGEATLRWGDLLTSIAHASALGLPTRVVSNAHWATSREQARRRIDALQAAGLSEINYSTGDEHARFVPVERVVTASLVAIECDLPLVVMIELRAERRVTRDTFLRQPILAELAPAQMERLRIVESPWMPLEPDRIERYPAGRATDASNLGYRAGCNNVLQTYTLQADGRVGACCGIGMRLIDELSVVDAQGEGFLGRAIEEAEGDFLKLWVRTEGPERILAWAAEKDPSIEWQGQYAHHCQACARLYRDPKVAAVIHEHHGEMLTSVLESAWIDEWFAPRVVCAARRSASASGDGVSPTQVARNTPRHPASAS